MRARESGAGTTGNPAFTDGSLNAGEIPFLRQVRS